MGPRFVEVFGDPPNPGILGLVANHLRGGGLVAMPTETVYGFGGTLDDGPLTALQNLKGRREEKPFLVLVPGMGAVSDLLWTAPARELARVFWPGGLTLVLADVNGRFPPGVQSPRGTVAIRQSPHPVARGVLELLGEPIISTSANPPGGSPALNAREAGEAARALGAQEELWVLDHGPLGPSKPSTIVDCSGEQPVVLREGAVPLGRLRCVLPEVQWPV